MTNSEIAPHIHYIGVNDRTTALFESLWPLPNGVSYNSYLITGSEKVAIIDGVEVSHALEQIDHIKTILGDRTPDYLIINHMEPDHSGGISLLRSAFPGLTIVGNAQTLAMVKGFYGVTDNTLAIKDGDTLELGSDVTLQFFLTPMVHWPETMMTYFKEGKALFSGDAFGCFGALNGAIVDHEMNTERYFPEMVRYYSNIVGKYGQFVQRALAKLANAEIEMICSTHGPVWQEEKERVVDLYNRLSQYQPLDNGVTIVYGSMYGNTARMAEAMARQLALEGVKEIVIHNASVSTQSQMIADCFAHRGLVIAAPTYSDGLFPPVAALMKALTVRGLKNREVALLGSHTWSPQGIKMMQKYLEAWETEAVAAPVSAKHAPDRNALSQCAEAASALASKLR